MTGKEKRERVRRNGETTHKTTYIQNSGGPHLRAENWKGENERPGKWIEVHPENA
jgi:hypothetical protein